ncbi:TonB-dependent receptor plug domain-containing protein [Hymenobacter humi]|uniref:TonB-dependent receptor plug domain-containing protein n=1 Tax=Hymenobacter humi TaxID=1411620 RepID=A0ABW2U407_9BACT
MPKFLPTGFLLFGAFIARAQQVDTLASAPLDTLASRLSGRSISFSATASTATAPLPYYTTFQPMLSRVAGVQVTPYSGAPGAGAVVRLRGAASLDSNVQPLYVVDGVPVFQYRFDSQDPYRSAPYQSAFANPDASTNPLLSIAPEDIEQVEVLKGAFETAQYGFLGQNGVIRISTRRGRPGSRCGCSTPAWAAYRWPTGATTCSALAKPRNWPTKPPATTATRPSTPPTS